MADNYQIDLTLEEIFGTGISSIEQTTVSTVPGGTNVWTVTLTNGNIYNFNVMNGTAGGDPAPVLSSADMTDLSAIYLYLGTETGFTFGHWYYNDGSWIDGGAYGAKGDKGDDGVSPTASVSKSGTTTTITITDENGTTTAQVEDGVRPVVNAASAAGDMTDTDIIYVYVGATTASLTNGDWYFYDGSAWVSGGAYNSTALVTDKTLTQTDMAADAKKTGDEITDLKSAISNCIPFAVKQAMDTLFQNVAFKDDNEYRDELNVFHAWATAVNLLSISAVYTQSGTVYTTDTLDSLKSDLVVTATYDNGTSATVTGYTLSGELNEEQSTVTVTYEGKTTTFNVTVSVRTVDVENGTIAIADGTESENNARARTDYIPVTNRNFIIDADINTSDTASYAARYYDSNYQYIGGSDSIYTVPKSSGTSGQYILDGWMAGNGTSYTDQTALQGTPAYVRFLMRTTAGTGTITNVSGTITVDGVQYEIVYA